MRMGDHNEKFFLGRKRHMNTGTIFTFINYTYRLHLLINNLICFIFW